MRAVKRISQEVRNLNVSDCCREQDTGVLNSLLRRQPCKNITPLLLNDFFGEGFTMKCVKTCAVCTGS